MAENSLKDFKVQLSQSENDRKSVVAALEGAERQAGTQRKQLHQDEFDLAFVREQNKVLLKMLEEVEKAKNQVEQDGYNVEVAETKEAFKSKVSGVCRVYCSQMWDMALNRERVEASSALRRPENIYYPLPFRSLAFHFPQMTHFLTLLALLKKPLPKILPSPAIHREKKSRLRSKKPSRMPPLM